MLCTLVFMLVSEM